uniref:ATP synthase F0 subunit 8 n=1 Tax=Eumacrocentrus sp. QL-2013 TaxID=1421594 RepID=A0A0A6ZL02_9HYME|nr:ATP synthase F0 subunit 8 [Eumacrocentrus sp. QL-2013]
MPQMSPMDWFSLNIYFLMIYYMMMLMIYFIIYNKFNLNIKMFNNYNNMYMIKWY